jgi:hypothetical protein
LSSRAHDLVVQPDPTGGAGDDRRISRLLSALAEAPDYASAASFLLTEIGALAGNVPAALLRFVPAQDALVLVDQVRVSDADVAQLPKSIEDRSHPLFVSGLSLTPVIRETHGGVRAGRFGAFHEWTALPLPQPHYRGAPALMNEAQAQTATASAGARLLLPRQPGFNTAPGAVVVLMTVLHPAMARDLAEVTMMAGAILARIASLEWWKEQGDRLSRERDRLTLMVDSLPDAVVITNAANDIIAQNRRA